MQQPKVSVLVPIYNVEKHLHQCLESLQHQTLEEIEIICINDGSTDGSGEIIAEFVRSDRRFSVINKKNTGYGDSMNCGLAAAKGEYIGILESDDFAEPVMYSELYAMASNEKADIVRSRCWFYWDEFRELKAGPYWPDAGEPFQAEEYPETMTDCGGIWEAVYRREFLVENNIKFLPTPGAAYQDVSFWFTAAISANRMFFLNRLHVHYRQGRPSASTMNHNLATRMCVHKEMEAIEKFIHNSDKKYSETVLRQVNNLWINECFWVFYYVHEKKKYLPYMRCALEKILFNDNYEHRKFDGFENQILSQLRKGEEDAWKYYEEWRDGVEPLRRFAEKHREVYIYGVGGYGRKIYLLMRNAEIVCNGVVSTEYEKKYVPFFFLPYVVLNEKWPEKIDKDIGFVLALNDDNRQQVEKLLKEKGNPDTFVGSRYANYLI